MALTVLRGDDAGEHPGHGHGEELAEDVDLGFDCLICGFDCLICGFDCLVSGFDCLVSALTVLYLDLTVLRGDNAGEHPGDGHGEHLAEDVDGGRYPVLVLDGHRLPYRGTSLIRNSRTGALHSSKTAVQGHQIHKKQRTWRASCRGC